MVGRSGAGSASVLSHGLLKPRGDHCALYLLASVAKEVLQKSSASPRQVGSAPEARLLNLESLEERITLNATYNVTTTTDFAFTSVNNSTGAITASGDPTAIGQVTLRSAIQAANNTPSARGLRTLSTSRTGRTT